MERGKNPALPVRYAMYAQELKLHLQKAQLPRLNTYTLVEPISKVA